jgi:hypothetical protein
VRLGTSEARHRTATPAVSKETPFQDREGPLSWEPPIGIEPMTYALRVWSRALLARSEVALASRSLVAADGDRWLLTAVPGI